MNTHELSLTPDLSQGVFLYENSHAFLATDAWKHTGPNIGKQGENLTISFLSMNRSSLSEKLLRSIQSCIPQFAGEVLVIDNGSSPNELDRLKTICAELELQVRIVELGQNFGVAGGRNRTIAHVTTDWLMCLDNDTYFITNPLMDIQRDLAILGCHFMSLPLLNPDGETIFACGGHLYVSYENKALHIGAGSACKQIAAKEGVYAPFIASFLFGGACVLNKKTFSLMGGYDEGMFIGFEDIDFSIRLFQQGYKVGATTCFALIHDHPRPVSNEDRDYERARFSQDILQKSAMHFEAKHGLKVWSDNVESWLTSRHRDLGLADVQAVEVKKSNLQLTIKPKIALVIDTDDWAFARIAGQLQGYLRDRFDFLIIPMDVIDNIDQVFLLAKDCEIVHFFWREYLTLIGTPYYRAHAEKLGLSYDEFHRRFISTKLISTSVYDHLLLDEKSLKDRRHLYQDMLVGYTVSSEKLNAIYSNISGIPAPTKVIEDGIDLAFFQPINIERLREVSNRDLIIGWVGNSKWAAELEDFKEVNTILKPAILQLQQEGVRIKACFADRQESYIPHTHMPNFYSQIDVLVCTSKIEGTPNPVLEAMACGVPIISTDVGIVPEALGDLQKECIMSERSVEALKVQLRRLIETPERLLQYSAENLDRIKRWDWKIKAKKFEQYFDQLLHQKIGQINIQ